MLALRLEILDYIIKTHCISAEQSTITEIRAACEDFERSQEYGKPLAALQSRSNMHHSSAHLKPSQPSSSSVHKRHSHRPGHTTNHTQTAQPQPRPAGKETTPSRPYDARARTSCDSKGKYIPRSMPRESASKDSCYNCGRQGHFAKNCPDPPRAKGYAVRLEEEVEAVLEEPLDTSDHVPHTPMMRKWSFQMSLISSLRMMKDF